MSDRDKRGWILSACGPMQRDTGLTEPRTHVGFRQPREIAKRTKAPAVKNRKRIWIRPVTCSCRHVQRDVGNRGPLVAGMRDRDAWTNSRQQRRDRHGSGDHDVHG